MCYQEEPLTEKQQYLVEKNHNLIYSFADSYNIDIEEYYGVLAIGLCKAAKAFDAKKGKFSTIAYVYMKSEWLMQIRKDGNVPCDKMVSYEKIKEVDEFQCVLVDDGDKPITIDGIMMESLVNCLNDNERKILFFLMLGMTHEEVAQEIGCTRQNVGYHVKEIRKKAEYFIVN